MKSIALTLFTALALTLPSFADEKGHSHAKKDPGPNGGRVITAVKPHLEFLVTPERTVQITALTDALKPTKLRGQIIAITAGERSNPTKLELKEVDGLLVSSPLPAGNAFPVSVSIKSDAKAKATYEKFTLDLGKCPTCKLGEYACICAHTHDDDAKKK